MQVFDEKDEIENLNDQYWQLRAEAVPEDQLSVTEPDQLIPLSHFSCDQQSSVSRAVLALLNACAQHAVTDLHAILFPAS